MITKGIKFFICSLTILILIFFTGCSKGKNNNSNPVTPVTGFDTTSGNSTTTLSFTVSGSPVGNSVYLEMVAINNDQITLAIKIKGGSNVYGAVMEITYNSSKINYVSSARGDYLGGVGDTFFFPFLVNGREGRLHIAIDKQSAALGSNGDGIIATVVLKVLIGQTDTPIIFDRIISNIFSANSNSPIPGTSWFGGMLSYQ